MQSSVERDDWTTASLCPSNCARREPSTGIRDLWKGLEGLREFARESAIVLEAFNGKKKEARVFPSGAHGVNR